MNAQALSQLSQAANLLSQVIATLANLAQETTPAPAPEPVEQEPTIDDARKALLDFGASHGAQAVREFMQAHGWKNVNDTTPKKIIAELGGMK